MRVALSNFLNISYKIVWNYIIIFLVIWWKKICKFGQGLSCKHKINKSNTKIFTYYWIIWLYSKNICCYGGKTIDKCFNFFWNMFYTEKIKVTNIIIPHIQSNPMSSNIRVLIKICYISPSFILGNISLE